MLIIIISIVLIYQNNKDNEKLFLANKEKYQEIEDNETTNKMSLPTIDNFENFYQIIKQWKGCVFMDDKKNEIILFENQNVKLEVNICVKKNSIWILKIKL